MTCEPEPKPICMRETLHTLCLTKGPLATFKLHARVYGGVKDDDLDDIHNNTSNLQKQVNLYNLIFESFKGKDRCMTIDMRVTLWHRLDVTNKWHMNRIGTAKVNQTGADVKATIDNMKAHSKGTYKSAMW